MIVSRWPTLGTRARPIANTGATSNTAIPNLVMDPTSLHVQGVGAEYQRNHGMRTRRDIERMETSSMNHPVIATYREFAPRRELRNYVRSFFSFVPPEEALSTHRPAFRQVDFRVPSSFCSPIFADADASLVI